ncbi:TetR/AcrR family transcriptional regulator [Cellulosimicrobium cellulans]|uniref:TetR/AcrR family transcriptional regulator n=1 Tax=Cellulosimicrobium cellulans TaxID=1710 RepID=UPI0036EE5D45
MIISVAPHIIDVAAGVFARHGYERTSVQAIADAAGYSKAGLLHHFPTKQALYEAVLKDCEAATDRVCRHARGLPVGPDRDRRAIELLVDLSLSRPGLVSLLLSSIVPMGDDDVSALTPLGDRLFEAFDSPPTPSVRDSSPAPSVRYIRITGALVALGVLSLQARRTDTASETRNEIVQTSFDALGHH